MKKVTQGYFWFCLLILFMGALSFPSMAFSRNPLPWLDKKAFVEKESSPIQKAPSTKLRMGSFPVSPEVILGQNLQLPYDNPVSLAQVCRDTFRRGTDLESRLEYCPILKAAIVWETGSGERHPYAEWTGEQKARLEYFFQALLRGDTNLGIHCPDPARAMAMGSNRLYLSTDEAFDIYVAHVAHVFYLEASNRVPWSVTNLPPQELEELLASYRYHSRITSSLNVDYPSHIQANRDFQRPFREHVANALVCDPRDGYRFLRGETSTVRRDLLGTTEEETLKNITWWFFNNVLHTDPLSREERLRYVYLKDRLRRHGEGVVAPLGCHTAANLFYDLAKSVNIPLKVVGAFELEPDTSTSSGAFYGNTVHEGLIFRWDRLGTKVLWHVDLIYQATFSNLFPIEEGIGTAPMTPDRTSWKLFDTMWSTPGALRSWGFNYLSELPTVISGIGYGIHSRGIFEDEPDFGQLAGFWRRACLHDGDINVMPCLTRASFYEQEFQLCSWDYYLDHYCGNRVLFRTVLDLNQSLRPDSFSLPVTRSGSDYFDRAEQCVIAYGGCSNLNHLVEEHTRTFGTDTWSDR